MKSRTLEVILLSTMTVGKLFAIAALLLTQSTVPLPAQAASMPKLDQPAETALLTGDWLKLAELPGNVAGDMPSPIVRFIKGQACLALNRNNESVRLLHDSGKSEDESEWLAWTGEFARKYPNSVIALYLKGDALARRQRLDEAVRAFTEALRVDPKHPLVLNARGVSYASLRKWNESIVDLQDATISNPNFADAYANRGSLGIRRSLGAPGALLAFNKALEISPDFALAKIGKASALFGLGKWSEAQTLLEQCKNDPDSGHLAVLNEALVRDAASRAEVAGIDGKNAGTELVRAVREQQTHLDSLNNNILKDDMGRIEHTFAADTLRDIQAPFKEAANTFQGIMQMRSGNFEAGASKLASVADTLGRNEQNIAGLHGQSSLIEGQQWSQGMNNLMSLRSSGLQGGVSTEDLRRGYVDKGNWRLLARFALQYPEPTSGKQAAAQGK